MQIKACTGIIIQNNKVLAVKSNKRTGGLGFPGGKKEENETDLECLIREIKEETSIIVIKSTLLGKKEDIKWETNIVALFYVLNWAGKAKSSIEGETLWVDWEDLINPVTSSFPIWNAWAYDQYIKYMYSNHK